MIVFTEIKRFQNPQSTQIVQKAKICCALSETPLRDGPWRRGRAKSIYALSYAGALRILKFRRIGLGVGQIHETDIHGPRVPRRKQPCEGHLLSVRLEDVEPVAQAAVVVGGG